MPMRGSYHSGISQERVEEIRTEALEKLIDQAYKVRYALAEEIPVDNSAVDARIEPIMSKFDSRKAFEKALGEEGVSAFRATVYRELLAGKAESIAVDSKVSVSEEAVRSHYDKNRGEYKRPRGFRASQIFVKVDPASNKEERSALIERAEGLAARAKAGEDFYDLAYYNSDDRSKMVGGDLGYLHEGRLVSEFERALVQMEVGEIAGPIKSRFGYHVIKLVQKDEAKQLSFEEAEETIRQSLEKAQRETLYADWMSGLKSQYQLKRFDH